MKRTIAFYTTAEGKCPMREFLNSLSGKAAQKVVWVLSLLEDLDFIPSTYFKKLTEGDGIWECKVQFGSIDYRLLCFFADGSEIILTHGFIKKSRKTPRVEIKKTKVYREDFLRRRK